MMATVAAQQITSLRRQRVFLALLATLLVMTALAGVIGWSSANTITRVYGEAVRLLAAEGKAAPPNPIGLKPALSLLSNMAIYIPLIGALLAVVLGNLGMADDKTTGVGRLIFSRQLSRTSYVLGKILGSAAVLAVVLVSSLLVSVASLLVVNGALPTSGELARLAVFYALSWLYLMLFALIGMVAVLLSRRRSLALLSALGAWLVLTFVVPQFTSGLRPTASLNPVTAPVSTSQRFFQVTAKARPVSVSEQYKSASASILQTGPAEPVWTTVGRTLPLAGLTVGLALLTVGLVRRHDYSRSSVDE